MQTNIALDTEKIAEFCECHPIRKLSLFGSVLREDFLPDSERAIAAYEKRKTPAMGWSQTDPELLCVKPNLRASLRDGLCAYARQTVYFAYTGRSCMMNCAKPLNACGMICNLGDPWQN